MAWWKKMLLVLILLPMTLFGVFLLWMRLTGFFPADLEEEHVFCEGSPPTLKPGQPLKVLSWNVQYMAGKNYVFFYDKLDGSGPDTRPSPQDITATLNEVARVIREEDPDVVLLQEVDDGARRTDGEDQLLRLLSLLPGRYACHSSSFYWKAPFVPHPKVMGAVGLKQSILSKYAIATATRHRLPMFKQDPVTDLFYIKRAVQHVTLPIEGRQAPFSLMNTHLDAFAQGTDTMQRQVAAVKALVEVQPGPWMIGGDFNLLAHRAAYDHLGEREQRYFNPQTELTPLFESGYRSVPTLDQIVGAERQLWLTHYPNDLEVGKLDRTIDYIFYDPSLRTLTTSVRQSDTQKISDHLPVILTVEVP